jgi:hypothetical protein
MVLTKFLEYIHDVDNCMISESELVSQASSNTVRTTRLYRGESRTEAVSTEREVTKSGYTEAIESILGYP